VKNASRSVLPAAFAGLALLAACGQSSGDAGGGGGGQGGGAGDPSRPPPPGTVSLAFPEVVVPGGAEKTECVVLRLGNATPLRVGAIHNRLGEGSHHLIVYRVTDTDEKRTPFACEPFTDTLDATKGSPLMVTQKADDLLTLPPGVAYSLEQDQMIRLEMHYINPTTKDRPISAKVEMIPIRDADFVAEADFLFIGNPDIRLKPKSTDTLGPTFFELPSDFVDAKFFAITGHQHQYGTNVQVWTAASKDDPGTAVYDVKDWRWSEPKTEVFTTPFTIPEKGGFKFTCTWNNTSDKTVRFGESANDEMCFFWAYYYPSHGAKVCFHTNQAGGAAGLDICCPDHPLCGLINDQLKQQN
jgi:hypothetical protein